MNQYLLTIYRFIPWSACTTLHKKIGSHSTNNFANKQNLQFWFIWANIAWENYQWNVHPWLRDNSYEKDNLYNVVSTMLGHCIGILSCQYLPIMPETTLHKKLLWQCLPRARRYICLYSIAGKLALSNLSGALLFHIWGIKYRRLSVQALILVYWL